MDQDGGGSSRTVALAERRAWLFQRPRGHWRGIDLDLLDPSDPHDRAILLRAEHPGASWEDDDASETPAGTPAADDGTQPQLHLHLAIHEVLSNQLWAGDPPEVGETADRLRGLGYERHEILHMLGSVVAEELRRAMLGGSLFETSERTRLLDALPGAWGRHEEDEVAWDDDEVAWGDDEVAWDDDDWDDDDWDEASDDGEELDELLHAAHRLLGERGPLALDELAEELGLDEEEAEVLLEDPALVFLGGGRVASACATLDGATLTHRLSPKEVRERVVVIGSDLAPLEAFACSGAHLHLSEGRSAELRETADHEVCLSLDDLGLPPLGSGAVIGFAVAAAGSDLPTIDPLVLDEAPAMTDTVHNRLRTSFDLLGRAAGEAEGEPEDQAEEQEAHGEAMPATPLQLLCQLLLDAPALASQPLPPFGELLERAGLEVRDGYAAPVGTDWTRFERARSLAIVASHYGLEADEVGMLAALVQAASSSGAGKREGTLDRRTEAALAHAMCDSALAEAFAEAVQDDPGTARSFIRHLRQTGGHRHEAGLWWCESLVAGRSGDVEAAQACVRAAIAADPEHLPALRDAAWYASDRGDAAEAVRLLERAEDEDEDEDEDEQRAALLRRFALMSPPTAQAGRNDPCPCGSGRKYKQCCLTRPGGVASPPLHVRVPWLWDKMRWWLERFGPFHVMLAVAFSLQSTRPASRSVTLTADLDLAASLVLFADGAVADFAAQRAPLLPVDEADLAAQWARSAPSVHEVGHLRAGEGFSLTNLRGGDVVDVRERSWSRSLRDGDLVLAHPVFDGDGYQIVGGAVPVSPHLRGALIELLDNGASAFAIALVLASSPKARTAGNRTLDS
ncbi:MAG: SEC-C metal-binding domain-containing protein [Actinomycetota bacterium]|nr:SEC-C metal-binding domain-containing protein [Actinomycetota bacterium]